MTIATGDLSTNNGKESFFMGLGMTLLELLVKELPGKGGWPKCSHEVAVVGIDNILWTLSDGVCRTAYMDGETVIREQYESALAASKQPAWNGEGLPPVGCRCRFLSDLSDEWEDAVVCAYYEDQAWLKPVAPGSIGAYVVSDTVEFRPIRTEAERRRDEIILALAEWSVLSGRTSIDLYHAIADGKIPGVKLEDV